MSNHQNIDDGPLLNNTRTPPAPTYSPITLPLPRYRPYRDETPSPLPPSPASSPPPRQGEDDEDDQDDQDDQPPWSLDRATASLSLNQTQEHEHESRSLALPPTQRSNPNQSKRERHSARHTRNDNNTNENDSSSDDISTNIRTGTAIAGFGYREDHHRTNIHGVHPAEEDEDEGYSGGLEDSDDNDAAGDGGDGDGGGNDRAEGSGGGDVGGGDSMAKKGKKNDMKQRGYYRGGIGFRDQAYEGYYEAKRVGALMSLEELEGCMRDVVGDD